MVHSVVYISIQSRCFYSLLQFEWSTPFHTPSLGSARNVLGKHRDTLEMTSASFSRGHSSLSSETVINLKSTSTLELSVPFLWRTSSTRNFCKDNAQGVRRADFGLHSTMYFNGLWSVMMMIGAPIRYVSNRRSPNITAYPSRSITDHFRCVSVSFVEAYEIGFSLPSDCFCAKHAAHASADASHWGMNGVFPSKIGVASTGATVNACFRSSNAWSCSEFSDYCLAFLPLVNSVKHNARLDSSGT